MNYNVQENAYSNFFDCCRRCRSGWLRIKQAVHNEVYPRMPTLGNLQVEEKPIDNGELADLSEGKTLRVELPQDAALRTIYGRIEMIFRTGANASRPKGMGDNFIHKKNKNKTQW